MITVSLTFNTIDHFNDYEQYSCKFNTSRSDKRNIEEGDKKKRVIFRFVFSFPFFF